MTADERHFDPTTPDKALNKAPHPLNSVRNIRAHSCAQRPSLQATDIPRKLSDAQGERVAIANGDIQTSEVSCTRTNHQTVIANGPLATLVASLAPQHHRRKQTTLSEADADDLLSLDTPITGRQRLKSVLDNSSNMHPPFTVHLSPHGTRSAPVTRMRDSPSGGNKTASPSPAACLYSAPVTYKTTAQLFNGDNVLRMLTLSPFKIHRSTF